MDITAPGEVVILDTPQLLPHISHVLTHFPAAGWGTLGDQMC